MRVYSKRSSGVFKYMLEMSVPIHFAPDVDRTLFQWYFTVLRPAVSVLVGQG